MQRIIVLFEHGKKYKLEWTKCAKEYQILLWWNSQKNYFLLPLAREVVQKCSFWRTLKISWIFSTPLECGLFDIVLSYEW